MEHELARFASYAALALELLAALLILVGAVESLRGVVVHLSGTWGAASEVARHGARRAIFVRFASWLVLGLEFELAADVLRTSIAPTWSDIGKLGAIAAIRTFLNVSLERDLEKQKAGASVAPLREAVHDRSDVAIAEPLGT